MESFYSCASFLSSADQGFAASGLLPECVTTGLMLDSHARGLDARLQTLDHVPLPVGNAWPNKLGEGLTEGLIRSSFDLGQGSGSREGLGGTLRNFVDSALLGGMRPG